MRKIRVSVRPPHLFRGSNLCGRFDRQQFVDSPHGPDGEFLQRILQPGGRFDGPLSLAVEESFPITAVAPWRNTQPLTAGLVAQWLRMEFTGLAFRDGFNRKSSIFTFPEQRGDPRLQV